MPIRLSASSQSKVKSLPLALIIRSTTDHWSIPSICESIIIPEAISRRNNESTWYFVMLVVWKMSLIRHFSFVHGRSTPLLSLAFSGVNLRSMWRKNRTPWLRSTRRNVLCQSLVQIGQHDAQGLWSIGIAHLLSSTPLLRNNLPRILWHPKSRQWYHNTSIILDKLRSSSVCCWVDDRLYADFDFGSLLICFAACLMVVIALFNPASALLLLSVSSKFVFSVVV